MVCCQVTPLLFYKAFVIISKTAVIILEVNAALMPANQAVKSTAKASLKKLWPECIAVCVILGINAVLSSCIQSIITIVWTSAIATVFSAIYFLFVTVPLLMGVAFWLWRVTVLSDSHLFEIFFPFSTRFVYARVISFIFAVALRLLIALALFMLPFVLVKLASSPEIYEIFGGQMPTWTANFWIFENFFKVIGLAAFAFFASRFYLAPLLFLIGGDITPAESIYMSRRIGTFSYSAFLQLVFSFAGWAVLSLLILPAIYTLPYFLMCITVHCRYAINYYNSKQNQEGYSYTPPNQDFGADI